MRRHPRRQPEDEEHENFWKGLARDVLVAGIIVAVVLLALFAYAGNWPPLVVVESKSMQHGDRESSIGVIDTGDMVFQQAAPTRASIVTYLEGRATGYATYGDYGDVIIFRRAGGATPIIHRAIMYVTLHVNGTADVRDVSGLPDSGWDARNLTGPTRNPVFLRSLTIRHMGFERNINLTFSFDTFSSAVERSGYMTMGDNNSFRQCRLQRDDCPSGYDPLSWMPRQEDVQGRARGEIPWIGLIKLTLQPTDSCCPGGWGDPEAPKNSWDSLLVTLIFLVALPFILEYAGRGWTKYVSPHLPRIRWPWKNERSPGPDRTDSDEDEPIDPEEIPPREGSSEP